LACDVYGYGKATYTTEKYKDMVKFTCTTISTNDGHTSRMVWRGTVKGNMLDATAEMFKDGKSQGISTINASMETQTATKPEQ
jgi:hypothetical protein